MDFHRPETLAEALAIKAERPRAAPLAGDTDLMVAINFREAWRDAILDVTAGEPRSGGTAARPIDDAALAHAAADVEPASMRLKSTVNVARAARIEERCERG